MRGLIVFVLAFCLCGVTRSQIAPISKKRHEFGLFELEFEEAKHLAGTEGKLMLAVFYTSKCKICPEIVEFITTNPEISNEIEDNYIAFSTTTDNFDGFAWYNKYEINKIPSILILNSQATLLKMIENIPEPDSFARLLKLYNREENKTMLTHPFNISPKEIFLEQGFNHKRPIPDQVSVDERNKHMFQLMYGDFIEYSEVQKKYLMLKAQIKEPVIVKYDYHFGSIIYSLLIGKYSNFAEARYNQDIIEKKLLIITEIY